MKRHKFLAAVAAGLLLANGSSWVRATPYASLVTKTGTSVTYILNEDADVLTWTKNGVNQGPVPDGTGKGAHTLTLGSASDTFSIVADKNEGGFTQLDGGIFTANSGGASQDLPTAVGTLMSLDASGFSKYNSPRGIAVSQNPNSPNFGNIYISNSAASPTVLAGRTAVIGKGLYALKADQSDGYGYGDTAKNTASFAGASANSPYRLSVGSDGTVYTAGFADAASNVYTSSPDLNTNAFLLGGTTGNGAPGTATCDGSATACLPVGQNHGSILSAVVTGSTAGGNLQILTVDEDMTNQQLTRAAATDPKGTDNNKLWKYSIGGASTPYTGMPTAVTAQTPLIPAFSITVDMDQAPDGKVFMTQTRAAAASALGVVVVDPNTGAVLYDSFVASKAAYNSKDDFNNNDAVDAGDYVLYRKGGPLANESDNPGTVDGTDYTDWRGKYGNITEDLFRNTVALAISPDGKTLATLGLDNNIVLTPLVGGLPDTTNSSLINTGNLTGNGRDIAYDAAGNLYYVSSGQGLMRVLAAGGHTVATTTWNGTSYAFNVNTIPGSGALGGGSVPEPGTLVLAVTGMLAVGFGRRRR